MRSLVLLAALSALTSACKTTGDPAEGGFFSGVAGVAGGGYQARVDEREQAVAAAQAENAALRQEQAGVAADTAAVRAEIEKLRRELAKLKFTILQQKTKLGTVDDATGARIDAILNAKPGGSTDVAKLAALRKTVADARALSAELAGLSG
ncbi:MAG: hypothetical protein ACE5FS_05305 [Paracoccaceae bacterium]